MLLLLLGNTASAGRPQLIPVARYEGALDRAAEHGKAVVLFGPRPFAERSHWVTSDRRRSGLVRVIKRKMPWLDEKVIASACKGDTQTHCEIRTPDGRIFGAVLNVQETHSFREFAKRVGVIERNAAGQEVIPKGAIHMRTPIVPVDSDRLVETLARALGRPYDALLMQLTPAEHAALHPDDAKGPAEYCSGLIASGLLDAVPAGTGRNELASSLSRPFGSLRVDPDKLDRNVDRRIARLEAQQSSLQESAFEAEYGRIEELHRIADAIRRHGIARQNVLEALRTTGQTENLDHMNRTIQTVSDLRHSPLFVDLEP